MNSYLRIIIPVLVCMANIFAMQSETVTRKEANSLAWTFFNAAFGEVTPPPQLVWNGRQLTTDRLFSPIYVYNSPRGAYVIISAENKAFPILGYSLKRNFEREKLSEVEKKLLEKYAREIEIIRYDPRMPVKALEAWQNLPDYISEVISNPYNTEEYKALESSKKEELELADRTGNQILMPQATEFYYYNPDDYRDITLDDLAEEADIPFKFYEDFIRDVAKEQAQRDLMFEELISPSKPMVKALGGGHFEVDFPENISMVRVYEIGGMQMMEKYYKETSVANLDMSALGNGYYVMLALSENGKVYGLKLYR